MAMSSKRVIGLLMLPAVAALSGCNTWQSHIGDEDPFVGESVKYNAAIQTINPTPVYPAGSAQPGDSGAKGVAAVKRYRTDAVKALETMSTSAGGTGPR
jgi:hypothetical protein